MPDPNRTPEANEVSRAPAARLFAEQDLFARLSVFSGGFTLEAAEAVGAGGRISEDEVLGTLGSLVEQSLIAADANEENDEVRYRMLEPVR